MAIGTTTALVIAGTAAAASAGASIRQGNIAKANSRLQQRQADSRSAAERRQIVRQDRIRRAQVLNQASQTGTQGSSSEAGAISGITNQTAQNLGQSKQFQAVSRQISSNNQTSSNIGSAGALFGAVGSTASLFV